MRKMQEARTGRAKLNLAPLADGCVRLRCLPSLSLPHRSPEARTSYRALVALPSPRASPSPSAPTNQRCLSSLTFLDLPSISRPSLSQVRLYLVRHGQTDWNVEGRIQGRTDNLLNPMGKQQAAALASFLSQVHGLGLGLGLGLGPGPGLRLR